MQTKEEALSKLRKSKFRSRFKLSRADIEYIDEKGLATIRQHAKDFVKKKIEIRTASDGTQTPMTGHPVFKAMHGCACCCRGCLNKWYNVPLDVKLTEDQQDRIVNLLMLWIEERYKEKENG